MKISLYFLFWTISLVSALMLTQPTIAQENITIKGRVVDSETKEPLSFASLRIAGKAVGTVTNDDGEFEFSVPMSEKEDTLIVSMMGYKPFTAPVKSIEASGNLAIQLTAAPIQLKEVLITDTKFDVREILIKAFENIERNYPVEPYILKSFYRETHQENECSVMLVEAALDIYDIGYKLMRDPRGNEKINLRNVRASKNYRNDVFKNTVVENYNLVSSALRWNQVKYRSPNFLRQLKDKTISLDSVILLNDRTVYAVSFLSYLSQYPLFERKNIIYIDAENYAIYKYGWEEYSIKGKYSEKPWPLTKGSNYLSARKRISTMYEYESYRGKMYLKYFDEKCYDDIYNVKGDSVEFEQLGHTTLIITEIQTGQVNAETKNPMDTRKSLHVQAKSYDPGFWRDYDQLVPLTRKQVRDLEKEIPLEKQYQFGSTKKMQQVP